MATVVKRAAKINFYKFVPLTKIPTAPRNDKAAQRDIALQTGINKNTQALNNIGATLNSLGKIFAEFKESQATLLQNMQAGAKLKFQPIYAKPTGGPDMGKLEGGKVPVTEAPGWFETIFGLIKDFLILAIAQPALKWLSDPANADTIRMSMEVLMDAIKLLSSFISDRIKGWVDNMYYLLSDDKTWFEKLGYFFKAFINFAGLFLAIRWLRNPGKLVKDLGNVLGMFFKGLKAAKFLLLKRTKALAVGAAVVGTGVLLYQATRDKGEEKSEETPEKSTGGPLPQRAAGGFINGPMSGYPVSLTGKGIDFIGHGKEYVAQKKDGGYVIPLDTPATKKDPGLTLQRMSEASNMGFDLSGLFGRSAGGILPQRSAGGAVTLTGESKKRVGNDKEFLKRVNEVSAKIGANPADLLGLMASESGLNPQARNRSGATGLIQFMPGTARGLGTTTDALYRMNRAEQMVYVDKFLTKFAPKNPTPGHLYTSVFLPAFAKKPANYVVAKKGGFRDDWGHHPASWYSQNSGLDLNKDGSITIAELGQRIKQKQKSFGIGGGSRIDVDNIPDSPTAPGAPPAGAAANPFSFEGLVKGLQGIFGGKPEEPKKDDAKTKPNTKAKVGPTPTKTADEKVTQRPPEKTAPAAKTSSPPKTTASAVTNATSAVNTARSTRQDAQVQVLSALQQQQALQQQRVEAMSQASIKAVAEAQNAANSKVPTVVTGGAPKRDLIAQLQSDNSLLKTRS
jgi:hypothetical protein